MLLVRYQQLQFIFWKKSLSWSLLTADPEGTSSQFLTFLLLLPEPTPGSASYANAGTFYMNFLEEIPLWWYQSFSAPSNTTFSAPCHNTQGAHSDPVLWVAVRLQATPDKQRQATTCSPGFNKGDRSLLLQHGEVLPCQSISGTPSPRQQLRAVLRAVT